MQPKDVPLLHGSYAPADAREILGAMIKAALQHQRLQDFQSLIRYDGNCAQASANIQKLCRAQEELDRFLEVAKTMQQHLSVRMSLQLDLTEAPVEERSLLAIPFV
ncbi:hypothetical protein [Flaviaesturariibacter amylovorans]|uniref:Uncharacterized protein n=1 Tax=Flaviaesturariibacter amylovorans TaxID=1084520 RepID=A0ABP8HS63_9BACT